MTDPKAFFAPMERRLLLEMAEGSEAAFTKLFNAYKDRLFTIAFKVTESAPQSEEIVQDVFLKLWQGRKRLPEITHFDAYLLTSIRNQAFTALKQKARQPRVVRDMTKSEGALSLEIESYLQAREHKALLQKAMQALPPQQKLVFKLIKLDGLSREEAAAQLNISPASVKAHLELAMRTVRNFCIGWIKVYLIVSWLTEN